MADDDAISVIPDGIQDDLDFVRKKWLSIVCLIVKILGFTLVALSAGWAYLDAAWFTAEFKKEHPVLTDPILPLVVAVLCLVLAVISCLVDCSIDKAKTRILLWCADERRKGGKKRQERAKSIHDEVKGEAKQPTAKEAGTTTADTTAAGEAGTTTADTTAAGEAKTTAAKTPAGDDNQAPMRGIPLECWWDGSSAGLVKMYGINVV